mmetsp:Transcript_16337/g.25394  ORF Transcript_16337/g.25394 Transcript_16337/m.25394 type:complete len:449 (-) Transcript_16337:389-1735(-)
MSEETKEYLLAEQEKVLGIEWEWIILKIKSLKNLPKEFLWDKADAYVHVKANGTKPPIAFDKSCNQYRFPVRENETNPEWDQLGQVAYVKGSAETINFTVKDDNSFTQDTLLLRKDVPIPTSGEWEDVTIKEGEIELVVSMKWGDTPLKSAEDYKAMDLTEMVFDLKSGEKATLVYKQVDGNKKAIVYFPGYFDSFAHPQVLDAFLSRGYDLYSCDPRGCGRARKYPEDPKFGHSTDTFDNYEEELDMTLDKVKEKDYDSVLAFCHSTGALVFANYYLLKSGETPFTGCIYNGPFLDWGHVGGDFNEFVLEHTKLIQVFKPDMIVSPGKGLGKWLFMIWLLYRFDFDDRPLIKPHLTGAWANAATMVQKDLAKLKEPLLGSKPLLLLSSSGDDTLDHEESMDLIKQIASNPDVVQFKHNNHDVLMSRTKALNDEGLKALLNWLDTKAP